MAALLCALFASLSRLSLADTDVLETLKIRPNLFKLENVISIPFVDRTNVAWRYESIVQFRFNVFVNLPQLTNGTKLYQYHIGRSKESEQISVFENIESYLDKFGLEGRICVLKIICECQQYAIRYRSIFGEVLHRIFTPLSSTQERFRPYFEAERFGRNQSSACANLYEDCPISLKSFIYNFIK